jgi:hypothetical protein
VVVAAEAAAVVPEAGVAAGAVPVAVVVAVAVPAVAVVVAVAAEVAEVVVAARQSSSESSCRVSRPEQAGWSRCWSPRGREPRRRG